MPITSTYLVFVFAYLTLFIFACCFYYVFARHHHDRRGAQCGVTGVRHGAALRTRGGAVYTGCNVEHPETTLSTDAARMAVLKAVGDGEAAIKLLVLTSDSDRDAFPYPGGAAREFLAGFGPVQ